MTLVAMGLVTNLVGTSIVCASDRLLSGDGLSLHLSLGTKVAELHDDHPNTPGASSWLIGHAGDPAHYLPMVTAIRRATTPASAQSDVVEAARKAYGKERERVVAETLLSPYDHDLTLREFLQTGLRKFGTDEFGRICEAIEAFRWEFQLLIGGVSREGSVRIVSFNDPGVVRLHNVEGVAAIGDGAALALGHLWPTYDRYGAMRPALYRMLEAKFVSEATRTVGPDTVVLSMSQDGKVSMVSGENCEAFRRLWELRRSETPDAMTSLLDQVEVQWRS